MRCNFVFLFALLCLTGSTVGFAQASIDGFFVGKKRDFLQTSVSTPTSSVILGDPDGPFHFAADLTGNSLNLLNPAPKVTTPASIQYALTGDSTDVGVVRNYSSKSALDAAFPNSSASYTFTGGAFSLPISLGAGDAYPTDIPQIINGTWNSRGELVIDAIPNLSLKFSDFTGYSSGIGGIITFNLYALSGNTVGNEMRYAEAITLTGFQTDPKIISIDGWSLQQNQTYYAELSFTRIANLNTNFVGSLGAVGVATFTNTTGFIISTAPPDVLPNFSVNPGDQTVISSQAAQFTAVATGYPAPVFQWQRLPAGAGTWMNLAETGPYSGTATAILNIGATTDGMNGDQFRCVATNLVGATYSVAAKLFVSPKITLTILQQPVSQVVAPGATATFTVTAIGSGPLSYRWNGVQRYGIGSAATLSIPDLRADDLGNYSVTVTDAFGAITSQTVTLSFAPASAPGVVAVNAGLATTLILKSDGTLWGLGRNMSGQIGDGSYINRSIPVQIASSVIAASIHNRHSLFIKTDRTLWASGSYGFGPRDDGSYSTTVPVQIATGVVSATAGEGFSLFIKSDGTLWAMGQNNDGQLGDGTTTERTSPVQVATGVVAASAGRHSLFIKADGTLWAMGRNIYGQLGDGTTINQSSPKLIASGVVAASAGVDHSLFVTTDGTLWAMGYNSYGQLGDGTIAATRSTPVAVTGGVVSAQPGYEHSLFIKSDGTLWGMGFNGSYQLGNVVSGARSIVPVQLATGAVSASAGGAYSTYVLSDGTMKGMGMNYEGQLGEGGLNSYFVMPIPVAQGPLVAPGAPSDVIVTDAAPPTGVRLTWNPTIAAARYEIWRSTTNNSALAVRISSNVPIALYYDLTAVSGTTYSYWVKAANAAGTSAFSSPGAIAPSNAIISIAVE